eukprot:gene3600-2541_t
MAKPFVCPEEYRAGLEEVKRAVGIRHRYLDSWIFLFYENKKFDVQETIAKLNRRDIMERTVFSGYSMTPYLKKSMRGGIVQYVGRDFEGRPVLYFNTARDFPKTEEREERQSNLDMFLSWSVRCSRENPTSRVTWLINQKDSSMMKNTDLIFQKDMALRISKFFPGVVARMYICNMSSALTFVMKPLLRQLPKAISDCIFMYSGSDLSKGKLLEVMSADVLPIPMGGKNDCDNQQNYEYFASCVETYFEKCIKALRAGITIKEMEMMEEYGVDREGNPVATRGSAETDDHADPSRPVAGHSIQVKCREDDGSIEVSPAPSVRNRRTTDEAEDAEAVGKQADPSAVSLPPRVELPAPNLKAVRSFPFASLGRLNQVQRRNLDELLNQLSYHADHIAPDLHRLMYELRDRRVGSQQLQSLKEKVDLLLHTAHCLLSIFPPTDEKLTNPLFAWMTEPLLAEETAARSPPTWLGMSALVDCTSPDNFLLSLQSVAVEYIDECSRLETEDRTTTKMLSRTANIWSANLSSGEVLRLLQGRYVSAWRKLVPYLKQYVECKVAMAIAEFIRYHGLLVSGGRIDTNAEWFTKLLANMVQYREMRRRNYIFHVFPPLFREQAEGGPPSTKELLALRGLPVSFRNVMHVVCLVEQSVENTRHQLASPVTVNIAARNVVEHYLEDTMSKIYITYESQRTGVSAQELSMQKQAEALRCLEAAQAPLTDFLFALSASAWIQEKGSAALDNWRTTAALLRKEEIAMQEREQIRERSRLLANGLAAAAFNMQGTFSRQAFTSDVCTQQPPEAHAMALCLLFVAAGACQLTELEGDASKKDSSAPSVDVHRFLNSMTNLHKAASSIADDFCVCDRDFIFEAIRPVIQTHAFPLPRSLSSILLLGGCAALEPHCGPFRCSRDWKPV